MLYLQVFIFLLLIIFLGSFIKRDLIRKIFLLITSYIFTLDLMAIFSKKTHIDYAFIANIDFSIVDISLKHFKLQITLFFLTIFLCSFLVLKCEKKFFSHFKIKFRKTITLLLLILTFLPNGVGYTFFTTILFDLPHKIKAPKEALDKLGIKDKFVYGKDITATSGKNVVFIYIESLEKGFLDSELFNDLTPNLNKLRKKWSFYDNYKSAFGSTWTMGALYATQTGLPTIFGLQGNNIFNNICEMEVPSIGNILKKAGYNQVFINGPDLKFAGVGNFFRYQGFKTFGSDELSSKYDRSNWGVRDMDVFKEAKKWYLKLSKENKPFNLTILTVDTHFPNGVPDKRFKKMFPNTKDVEYAVQSVDYLIGDFIRFLKKQSNYKDTVIYILPDHCIMGDESVTPAVKILKKQERGLFLLTNAPKENTGEILTFYDLPRIFLNGMQVKTNVRFFKELIPNFDTENKREMLKLQELNLSLNRFKTIKKSIEVIKSNDIFEVFIDGEKFDSFKLDDETKKYYPMDNDGNLKGNFLVEREVITPGMDLSKSRNKIEVMIDETGEPFIYFLRDNVVKLKKKKIKIEEIL